MSESTKSVLRMGAWAAFAVAASISAVAACSSDETRASFAVEDAGADGNASDGSLDGSFAPDDAGACPPSAPAKPLIAAPAKPFAPGSCSAAQIDGYVKECLESNGNACDAFKTANTTCASCVESASADGTWGPIVFYGKHRYYDYNYGGCIANVTSDFSDAGCGAAETRYLECRHAACVECLPGGFPIDYAPFYACQAASATDKLCATELADVSSACASYFATKPTDVCQAAGLPSDQYLHRLITAWCGGSPSDAGADAGDAGDGG